MGASRRERPARGGSLGKGKLGTKLSTRTANQMLLDDQRVREIVIAALIAENPLDPIDSKAVIDANSEYDHWLGDHDYRAWQRGYRDAMNLAASILQDAAADGAYSAIRP